MSSFRYLLALGSNIGNKAQNFRNTLKELRKLGVVCRTSFLYESAPMYVTNQPKFFNAACELLTDLHPEELLHNVQAIEKLIGRMEGGIRNGPREMDVDLLVGSDETGRSITIETSSLTLPHPRIAERAFVLAPVADIDHRVEIGSNGETVQDLLKKFPPNEIPTRIMQLGKMTHRYEEDPCLIMGVLNITPDSFSDGGKWETVDAALQQAEQLVNDGADLLDVGGQSTRPGSTSIGSEAELKRVYPIVRALSENFDSPISIDTYHSSVAEAAVLAGASWVNDISGGTRDEDIVKTCVDLGVALCVMHMRGTSETMQSMTDYPYGLAQLREELIERVEAVEQAGLPKWDVVVDPGIGFAKTPEFNLGMVQNWGRTVPDKYPVLSGPSRKRFIQTALAAHGIEKLPPASDIATGAVLSQIISSGRCHIARVHCVKTTRAGIAIGDALRFENFRNQMKI